MEHSGILQFELNTHTEETKKDKKRAGCCANSRQKNKEEEDERRNRGKLILFATTKNPKANQAKSQKDHLYLCVPNDEKKVN